MCILLVNNHYHIKFLVSLYFVYSKLLELNEKEEISEFISLEDELPALSDTCTLSPDEIYG